MHRSLPALACALTLAACGVLTPYRIDIQQGNYVSQEMMAKLKPGMTREQVRYLLGTPLVTDIFHTDRWDYVYTLERARQPRQQRRLAVYFQDGKMARFAVDSLTAGEARGEAQ